VNYKIILDEAELDSFIQSLPKLLPHEVWYFCLFGRHKYDSSFPNTRDSGQLIRSVARNREELKEKIKRMEVPVGSLSRDGAVATQQCLAAYIAVNPRSLIKANKGMLMETAKRFTEGQLDFNPISLSTTEIHRAVDRKFYVDFDYDGSDLEYVKDGIKLMLPDPSHYRILKTRGGFHLLVDLSKVKEFVHDWYQILSGLPGCDVKGSNTLTPIPGCTQGGFVPYFVSSF
jgi:hypothetical protein